MYWRIVITLLFIKLISAEISVNQNEAAIYKCPPNTIDGFYKNPFHPCSRVFFACANGDSFKEYCSFGRAYDERINECVSPESIPECVEAAKTTITPVTKSPDTTESPGFLCPGKGNFPDPEKNCSSQFFICVDDGVYGTSFRCAKRTYYDPELNQCLYYLDIPVCSGQPRTTRPPTTPEITTASIYDCINKPDGNYAMPNLLCPTFFIQCANNRTFPTNCPGILRYNAYLNQCLGPNLVPGCPGAPLLSQTTSTTPPVTQPLNLIDCAGLGSGYHKNPSQHCSDIYYACVGTTAILQRCPFGTRFDETSIICQFPNVVPDCNGKSVAARQTTKTTTVVTVSPVTTTAKPEFLFACNESFGNFPDPILKCSHIFYVCGPDSWVGHKFTCASGTFYDPELNLCDIDENVPVCTGQPRTSRLPTTTATTIKPEFECLYTANGNYILPGVVCPTVFYQCSNGETHPVKCPGHLKYDIVKDQCLPSVMVPGCPGGPPSSRPSSAISATTTGSSGVAK